MNQSGTTNPEPKPIRLEPSWRDQLDLELRSDRMSELKKFLISQSQIGKKIFPRGEQFFAALDRTPFERVRVVILGQDPYHGPGQAHGLSFSVPRGVDKPPSLINIFKELKADLDIEPPNHGCLEDWADQGVLLLNAVLSVEAGRAASHQGQGWEEFTNTIIQRLNEKRENIAFILWGAYAQKKAAFVDRKRHFVLESPHPSPLSAYRGFFGSKPFSRVNQYFSLRNLSPIDWQITR